MRVTLLNSTLPSLRRELCETTILQRPLLTNSRYYSIIHPTYPILPQTKARVSTMLSGPVRDALYEALSSAVRSFPSSSTQRVEHQSTPKATHLIMASQYENCSVRSFSTNLIYLQIMILLAITAENQATTRGQAGPPAAFWLASAIGFAYRLKLHTNKKPEMFLETDNDAEEKLARRIWWSLVIMDRWHAAGTSSPTHIPDESIVMYEEDQALLGGEVYNLARKYARSSNICMLITSQVYPSFSVTSPKPTFYLLTLSRH